MWGAAKEEPLLGDGLPAGWDKCFRSVVISGETRYVPTVPIHIVMMALCFINTFSGTFLVPHCKHLSAFFGQDATYAALTVCAPYITNIAAVYLSQVVVPRKGWLVATLVNCFFMMVGTAMCFCTVYFEPLRNPWLLLIGGLVYGMGMGFQYIGRQLGVATSSTTTRNKIFAQQTVATSVGILSGSVTSGLTSSLAPEGEVLQGSILALPFAVLFCLALMLALFVSLFLPNRVAQVPEVKKSESVQMTDREKKSRIWSTLVIGFNRVVVRSMIENETTAFYQSQCGHTELESSLALALAYVTGIIALELFGGVHDRMTDRDWIYVTLTFIVLGTLCQFPILDRCSVFETTKFTIGLCLVLPGLAVNTAVANSTATKYAIPTQWLYTQDMIGLLQIVTQTSLARIVGPFLGYVLAVSSMWLTLLLQMLTAFLSFALVYFGVASNAAETAKGRASLQNGNGKA